jgi:tetratricopeptide (TPR) repeat protein
MIKPWARRSLWNLKLLISNGRRPATLGLAMLLAVVSNATAQKKPKSTSAIDSLERKVIADSNDATVHYQLASAYLGAQRFDDSERELHEAVKLAPEYAEAYLALATIPEARGGSYWKKVEKDKGKSTVEAAFEAAGSHYRTAFLLNPMVSLGMVGKVEEHSVIYDGDYIIRIWWLQPFTKGLKKIHEGRYQEAFDLLEKILKDQKAGENGINLPPSTLWYHGLTAAHLGQYEAAVQDMAILTGRAVADEKAESLADVPLRANDFRYALATMLYLAGRYDQAAPTFRRALEFDVGLYTAHVQLARILEAQQQWDQAVLERRAAVDANPDDSGLLTGLGQTLLRAGKIEEAAEALDLAMEANPRDPASPYLAGVIALRLNRKDAARKAFERFLTLAPSRYAAQIVEVKEQLSLLRAGP